jgi:hypothetical protein
MVILKQRIQRGALGMSGTYEKRHFLNSPDRFDLVLSLLFGCATEFECQLQAWAVMSNHYHLSGQRRGFSSLLQRSVSSADIHPFGGQP